MKALRYDPTHMLTYGYWKCEMCSSSFYGGGPALHNRGCAETGYKSCAYVIGPNENTGWIGAQVTEEQKRAVMAEQARP